MIRAVSNEHWLIGGSVRRLHMPLQAMCSFNPTVSIPVAGSAALAMTQGPAKRLYGYR